MNANYPTRYRDRNGEVVTTIANDGTDLMVLLRGVQFRGRDFDALQVVGSPPSDRLALFTLYQGDLCSCEMEIEIPLPIATPRRDRDGLMVARLELGDPTPNGGID